MNQHQVFPVGSTSPVRQRLKIGPINFSVFLLNRLVGKHVAGRLDSFHGAKRGSASRPNPYA